MPHLRPPRFLRTVVGACAILTACASAPEPAGSALLPDRDPVRLHPVAFFEAPAIDESSGIAASRQEPGMYWTHNDSGGAPVLYALDGTGRLVGAPVRLLGATNVDWEDIAADDAGNLWVADIGNNLNSRTDLCLYVVPEPDPRTQDRVRVARAIAIRYPDQFLFPPPELDFDAEALFVAHGKPYVLTKHRGNSTTRLYRLDSPSDGLSAPLTLLASFDIGGMVTAADASPDGRRIVVLTYTAVWIFEAREGDDYFGGAIRWLPIRALQCEGVCFDADGSLVITNEQGQIFRLASDDLVTVRD
jgi:hypothetical protein